jgi:outer membrane receptor protein involved in Fe transport
MKSTWIKSALCGGVAIAALCSASTGWAQATNGTASASTDTVETVVVTAERRSENVQNIGGGITALTGADLSGANAHNFADFASTVPGLSYFSGGPTNNLIAIRGVTTGGTQLGSAIALYLDDVPLGASTQFGLGFQSLNINTFDLDRVEVLNGPQGTLYGANALGGTIKYVTAAPDLDGFGAKMEVEGSDTEHGGWNDGLRAMVNVPLFDGQAALRIDGLQEFDSGYTQDPDHDRRNVGDGRQLSGRVSFLADITPDLTVRLSAVFDQIQGSGADVAFRNFFTNKPVEGTYDQSYPLRQPSKNALNLYSAVVNWDLHWANLTSITGYQIDTGKYESDVSTLYDGLLGSTDPFGLPVNDTTKKFTQEVRLSSPDNKNFEWVLGGYYTRETTDENVDLVDPANPGGTLFGFLPFGGFLPSTYREYAFFGDATYYFTDNFELTGGIRYSQQHQNYQSFIQSLFFAVPGVVVNFASPPTDQSVVTYLINPRWHVSDDTMLYARVSSGYRPGGPNFVIPGSPTPPTFSPDKLWNYELGEKSTLLDGRATLDADIYDIEWKDVQTTVNVGGINQLVNAGNARVQGAELSFGYRVLDQLTLGGSAAYTDAKLTTPAPIIGVYNKNERLPLSAKFNFSLEATYNYEIGNGINGAINVVDSYVGDRVAGYEGDAYGVGNPGFKLPGYNNVNLNLSFFLPGNMEVDAYMKNVFDTRGEVSASTVTNQYLLNAPVPVFLSLPRTIGVVLKVATGP